MLELLSVLVMLALVGVVLAFALALVKLVVMLILLPVKLALGLVWLPFKLAGWALKLLLLPLLLVAGGLLLLLTVAGGLLALAVPLIPLAFGAVVIWVIARAISRPQPARTA